MTPGDSEARFAVGYPRITQYRAGQIGAESSPTNVAIGCALETGGKLWQPPRPSSRIFLTLVAMDGISGPLTGSPVAEVGRVAQSLRRSSITVVGAVSNAL